MSMNAEVVASNLKVRSFIFCLLQKLDYPPLYIIVLTR
jgi:hypothetical protein